MSAPHTNADRRGRVMAIVASIVVVAAVVAGIASIGLPGEQRQARLDQRRIEDLQRIVEAVELHHREHGQLPADLVVWAVPAADAAAAPGDQGTPTRVSARRRRPRP